MRREPEQLAARLQAALSGFDYIRSSWTERQREVVRAIIAAPSARAAAQQLGIPPKPSRER